MSKRRIMPNFKVKYAYLSKLVLIDFNHVLVRATLDPMDVFAVVVQVALLDVGKVAVLAQENIFDDLFFKITKDCMINWTIFWVALIVIVSPLRT